MGFLLADHVQPREMAQIVNTSVAAVKMSGSFAASDFSSSEDEGEEEEKSVRRLRSNAVSESCVTRKSPFVKTKTHPTGEKDSEALLNPEQKMLSSATNSYKATSFSSSCAGASFETETGSPEQRLYTEDPDSCQSSSTLVSDSKTLSSLQPRSDENATLTGQTDRDCDVDTTLNPNQENSSISDGGSHSSSPKMMSPTSSPMMVNGTSAHGTTSSNGALSSANASGTSSGSSLRDVYHQSR